MTSEHVADSSFSDTDGGHQSVPRAYLTPTSDIAGDLGGNQSLNNWVVIGTVSTEIDLTATQSGALVAKLGILVEHYYQTRDGNRREESEFINTVIFGDRAGEAAQMLALNERVYVEGRLDQRSFKVENGSRQYVTELIATSIWSLDTPTEVDSSKMHHDVQDPRGDVIPSMNSIMLIGNLGQDPELSYTANGVARTQLSLATNRRVRRNEEYEDETTWHRVTLWRRNAENAAQYLQRGRRVLVEGNVSSYKYTDDEGQERIFTSVQGQRIQYLTPQQTGNESAGNNGPSEVGPVGALDPDDLPF